MTLKTFEHILAHISFFLLFLATLIYWSKLIYIKNKTITLFVRKIMIIVYFSITIFLLTRWFYSGHLPLSNLYESSMFLSWSLTLIHIILDIKSKNEWLCLITAPSAMLTHGFATLGLPQKMQESVSLVPALQSHWLIMHVSMMILSYATLLCGSLLAMTFLIVTFTQNKNYLNLILSNFIYYNHFQLNIENNSNLIKSKKILSLSKFLKGQLTKELDDWSYRIISLGFPFLTLGILSGAVWANESWGSYWNWDPKETWALITWLIFAIYLHVRIIEGCQGKKPAIVASLGFFVIWICYLGVNLFGKGLHSYGWLV